MMAQMAILSIKVATLQSCLQRYRAQSSWHHTSLNNMLSLSSRLWNHIFICDLCLHCQASDDLTESKPLPAFICEIANLAGVIVCTRICDTDWVLVYSRQKKNKARSLCSLNALTLHREAAGAAGYHQSENKSFLEGPILSTVHHLFFFFFLF